MAKLIMQKYPRLPDDDLLDDSQLQPHKHKISQHQLRDIIISAIQTANKKSSRAILNIPEGTSADDIQRIYQKEGRELFNYFRRYCHDLASTAFECLNRHYSDVAKEQFRNRSLQKQRMNSAWRYQYIAKDAANASKRFESISDIGLREADFNAVIKYKNSASKLAIYVSVKNRSNTMGGQDWPKAIEALEKEAHLDKNRDGDYLCVFGITMERGSRLIRRQHKSGVAYSINTELWYSDFFWPFFSNYSYEEIAKMVLEVVVSNQIPTTPDDLELPEELLKSFESRCREAELLDEDGRFNDAYKLVELFCRRDKKVKAKSGGEAK